MMCVCVQQLLQGRFSMSCDAQVRQAEIPYVSLQRVQKAVL